MNTEEKMMHMFIAIHGYVTGRCYIEIVTDDDLNPIAVAVRKDNHECWRMTKVDLLFEYLTRDLE